MAWALVVALGALAVVAMLAAPEPARWAILICFLGFVGATLRLRRIH